MYSETSSYPRTCQATFRSRKPTSKSMGSGVPVQSLCVCIEGQGLRSWGILGDGKLYSKLTPGSLTISTGLQQPRAEISIGISGYFKAPRVLILWPGPNQKTFNGFFSKRNIIVEIQNGITIREIPPLQKRKIRL